MEAKWVRVLKDTEVGQGVVCGSEVVSGVEGEGGESGCGMWK